MKDHKNRSWFMKKDVCPVSGLPVSCRDVYVSDFPDADYSVEMARLGDHICLISTFGYVRSFDLSKLLRRFDIYIASYFTDPFFYIEDNKYFQGADALARKYYIDYFNPLYNKGVLLGGAFYNLPALYRFGFRLAWRFKIRNWPVYSVKTYAEALAIARDFINIPAEEVFENRPPGGDLTDPAPAYRNPDGSFFRFAIRWLVKLRLRVESLLIGALTRPYSILLLDYIAAIDWHKPGPVPATTPRLKQPFIQKILDAISYLKSELDDVFEQRDRAEAVLRESEQRYRLIVEYAKAGICEYDYTTNRIISANESFLGICGYSREAVLSMDPLDMLSASSRLLFMQRLEMIKAGSPISPDVAYEIITPDSDIKWVVLNTHVRYEGKIPMHATVIITDITEMKRAEEKLRNYQAKLKESSVRLSMAEERQRKRFAAQLHEQVSQELFVALMDINEFETSVADPLLAGALSQIKERLSSIIIKTRNLTFDLSPPVLYDLGLAAAVQRLAETLSARHGIEINTRFYVKQADIGGDEMKVILYRAIRELLHNCVKHARAHHVSIDARMNRKMLEIIVADDGVGFDTIEMDSWTGGHEAGGGGFGLFDIREKLSHLGGELVIAGEPGKGSRILMKIPVPQTGA